MPPRLISSVRRILSLLFLLVLSFMWHTVAYGQAENVPAGHPVYAYLKRLEVKGLIERYRDVVLPLGRREVGELLTEVRGHRAKLSSAEQGWLDDFLAEFRYDIVGSMEGIHSLISSSEPSPGAALALEFANREKFLYAFADSNVSLFVNGLLDFDLRRITGDALDRQHAEYIQAGGRVRGTALGRIGYYFQATNAQFWGSRELLERDPQISQSYGIRTADAKNFDFSDGYVRYDGRFFSVQLGHERVLWGYGQDQKMVLSDNVRPFDFIRADVQYKAIKYTFLHAWLLGSESTIHFALPFDTSAEFSEPVIADKFFAGHRLELGFPGLFDFGFQEMYIYSNRSVDLAYLNPFILLESAQRARGERDNGLWAFDIKTHFIPGLELHGTMLYDDIHVPDFFSKKWYDKYAWQAGMVYADAFTIPNTTLMVEYTHVEPWVFGHERSRDNSYTSLGAILGPAMGPNADSWFIRMDFLPARNLFLSARVTIARKGGNVFDSLGTLVRNVGADALMPHRVTDSQTKAFLDGVLANSSRIEFLATYEFINQMWLDFRYGFDELENTARGGRKQNHQVGVRVRTEL